MSGKSQEENRRPPNGKLTVTLPGTVEKIVPSIDPDEPEKAQIEVEGAEHLYREIRVDNTVTDASGREAKLKPGAHVDVTIAADAEATVSKNNCGV
jgi:hypothetical protein